jgi:hypothetical protein
MKNETPDSSWFCTHDGYSPANRGWWCDLGCGRDYNRMIEVPKRLVDKLIREVKEGKH